MLNPNWIPIEHFDKQAGKDKEFIFGGQDTAGKIWPEFGQFWENHGFVGRDYELIEPTHFLRPAAWQDIPDPDPLEAVRYWLMRVHELSQITPVSFQLAAESDNFPLPPTNS